MRFCANVSILFKEVPFLERFGRAREAGFGAGFHAAIVREVLERGHPVPPPCALIGGGEDTVTARGDGKGGPNGEFSLALALALEGVEGRAAFAADADGNDGPTDAAGGRVDGTTARAIRDGGVDPRKALERNESYKALSAGGALLFIGPTGNNVNDLRVATVRATEADEGVHP